MKEQTIELKAKQKEMLEELLRKSTMFSAMGFGDEHYVMIHSICERGYYFSWDREVLNRIREKYILWFIQLPF